MATIRVVLAEDNALLREGISRIIDGSDSVAAHGSRAMPIWGNVFRTLENQQTELLRVNSLMEYLQKLQAD